MAALSVSIKRASILNEFPARVTLPRTTASTPIPLPISAAVLGSTMPLNPNFCSFNIFSNCARSITLKRFEFTKPVINLSNKSTPFSSPPIPWLENGSTAILIRSPISPNDGDVFEDCCEACGVAGGFCSFCVKPPVCSCCGTAPPFMTSPDSIFCRYSRARLLGACCSEIRNCFRANSGCPK